MKNEQQDPLPWVPLCRLVKLEKARQASWESKRIKPLWDNFLVEGYYEPKGSFICSLDAPRFPNQEVLEEITIDWDDLWKQMNEEFEQEISGTCWGDLAKMMLYT